MIHWPDNMLTYVAEQKIAFSNDAFGQHIASYDIFDDAHGAAKCIDRAKDYYANIVMPYGMQVANKLKQIQDMNLDIDMIAPAHGIIWRSYLPELFQAYEDFATFKAVDKAVIVYESVWKHTQMMAEALAGKKRNLCKNLQMLNDLPRNHTKGAAGCQGGSGRKRELQQCHGGKHCGFSGKAHHLQGEE